MTKIYFPYKPRGTYHYDHQDVIEILARKEVGAVKYYSCKMSDGTIKDVPVEVFNK